MLTLVSALGTLVVLDVYRRAQPSDELSRKKLLASTIRTVGAILWPVVLLTAVPRADHVHIAQLALPLLWGFFAWWLDSLLLHHSNASDPTRPAGLRIDPNSLTALAFGMSGLIGARADNRYTHLFVYAILGCIVLVLPAHNLQPGCVEEQIFESVQKACLVWCLGLLIAGVTLVRSSTSSSA